MAGNAKYPYYIGITEEEKQKQPTFLTPSFRGKKSILLRIIFNFNINFLINLKRKVHGI